MNSILSGNKFRSSEYNQGYTDGFTLGYNPLGTGTFVPPQKEDKKNRRSVHEYKSGFGKGFWDGHKSTPASLKYCYDFTYFDFSRGKLTRKEAIDFYLELHYRKVVEVFDTYLDSALYSALKKCCSKQNPENGEIIAAIAEARRTPASFIPFLYNFSKSYLLRLFYVELTMLYDSTPVYRAEDSMEKAIKDFAEIYQSYRSGINPNEVPEKIRRSTTTRRIRKSLNELFKVSASSQMIKKDMISSNDTCKKDCYHKVFDLNEFISRNLVLMSLNAKLGDRKAVPSYNFATYISFIADKLAKERTLFTHCEKFKDKQIKSKLHNIGRDFSDTLDKYNDYAAEIDVIIGNLNVSDSLPEYICSEFLFHSHLLKTQFFCSLNSGLFEYISSRIDMSAFINAPTALPEKAVGNRSDDYYSLLEYLRFFDINMATLESCNFCSDKKNECSKLMSLISYEDISESLKMPLSFIQTFLHEIYMDRGKVLGDALQEFNSRQNLQFDYHNATRHYKYITGNAVTVVSNLAYGYGHGLDFSESRKVASFSEYLHKHLSFYFNELRYIDTEHPLRQSDKKPTANQALLINHLIHLAAFDGPI